jgi:outer membrane biosynthesis protein TonB
MRFTAKTYLWLMPLMLAGCAHKQQPVQTVQLAPPIVDAPPPKPAEVSPADLPPPVIGTPEQPKTETPPPQPPPAKKPVHHPKKTSPGTPPATNTPATPAPAPTDVASNPNPPPGVSAIGELSGGASGDLRTRTEQSLQSTEKGVNGISRNLSEQEQKTVAQIREFLKEANLALKSGDVDGAHTLADKAKVLLAELNQ